MSSGVDTESAMEPVCGDLSGSWLSGTVLRRGLEEGKYPEGGLGGEGSGEVG